MAVTFVAAFPIAAILDRCLGNEEVGSMTKGKMKKVIAHAEQMDVLDPTERKILSAAIDLKRK